MLRQAAAALAFFVVVIGCRIELIEPLRSVVLWSAILSSNTDVVILAEIEVQPRLVHYWLIESLVSMR